MQDVEKVRELIQDVSVGYIGATEDVLSRFCKKLVMRKVNTGGKCRFEWFCTKKVECMCYECARKFSGQLHSYELRKNNCCRYLLFPVRLSAALFQQCRGLEDVGFRVGEIRELPKRNRRYVIGSGSWR